MSDKKKRKAKVEAPSNKLTKEEDAIARFVRFNCPTNSTMFEGNEVHYFSAKKAVDCLVESKKYGTNSKASKFVNADAAHLFLSGLLEKGLFFRARKVVLKKKDKPEKKKETAPNKSSESPKPTKKSTAKDGDVSEGNAGESAELLAVDEESSAETKPQEEEKKKKKKVKLIFHTVQVFDYDPSDVYVWIFDPTPFFKKFIGLLIVLGTIAGCLFPLWPDWLRLVIYYLSVTGIALFGLLLGVALLRTIFFGIIWACTLGRHKLWLLPNLTEDCGFFESFKPVYTYEYVPGGIFGQPKKAKKKRAEGGGRKLSKSTDQKSENSGAPSAASSAHNTPKVEREMKSKPKKEDANGKSDAEEDERQITAEKKNEQTNDSTDNESEEEQEKTADQGDRQKAVEAESEAELRKRNVVARARTSSPADDDFVIVDSGATTAA